jgi:hypothetical protein
MYRLAGSAIIFYYVGIGEFLLLPLEFGKCDTSRPPITPRLVELLLPQPAVKAVKKYEQGKCKTDSDGPESEEDNGEMTEEIGEGQMPTPYATQ